MLFITMLLLPPCCSALFVYLPCFPFSSCSQWMGMVLSWTLIWYGTAELSLNSFLLCIWGGGLFLPTGCNLRSGVLVFKKDRGENPPLSCGQLYYLTPPALVSSVRLMEVPGICWLAFFAQWGFRTSWETDLSTLPEISYFFFWLSHASDRRLQPFLLSLLFMNFCWSLFTIFVVIIHHIRKGKILWSGSLLSLPENSSQLMK